MAMAGTVLVSCHGWHRWVWPVERVRDGEQLNCVVCGYPDTAIVKGWDQSIHTLVEDRFTGEITG